MKWVLRSPRRRRRAAWIAAFLVVAGGLSFVGMRFTDTGHDLTSPFLPGPVQRPPATPKSDPFTPAERRDVRAVAVRFISSAVFRKDVGTSWEITGPALRQGFTRSSWARGAIPVVPYPEEAVRDVRWRINYSFSRRVGLKVAFYPKPGARIERQVFDIELLDVGTAAKSRWIVSDWTPFGGAQIAGAAPGTPAAAVAPRKSGVRPIWLLAPVVLIVGSLVLLLGWLGIRGWIRQSRANRAYSNSS